jgi:hypothetical protein
MTQADNVRAATERLARLRNALGQPVDIEADEHGILRPSPLATTGRLVVAPGQTISSAWGNALWDQSVNQFENAADRANQWPAPQGGALSYRADGPILERYAAGLSAWVPLTPGLDMSAAVGTPPPSQAQYKLWIKTFVGTTGGAGGVGFAIVSGVFAYGYTPVLCIGDNIPAFCLKIAMSTCSLTNVQVQAFNSTMGNLTNTSIRANILAIGG